MMMWNVNLLLKRENEKENMEMGEKSNHLYKRSWRLIINSMLWHDGTIIIILLTHILLFSTLRT